MQITISPREGSREKKLKNSNRRRTDRYQMMENKWNKAK